MSVASGASAQGTHLSSLNFKVFFLLVKTFSRQLIDGFSQTWLISGFSSPQSIKLNPFSLQVNFTPHQPMQPVFVYNQSMAKNIYCPFLSGPTNVYYHPLRMSLQIQLPSFREWAPWRSILNVLGHATSISRYITIRSNCEIRNILMPKPGPYFRFPPPVIVLNARLKTSLSRWSEDRDNPQSQTQSYHTTNRILMMMRSLKSRIVIKLSILWQSYFLPMSGHRHYSRLCAYSLHRPRSRKLSVKRDPIEHINMSATLNNQIFHHIKTIQLSKPLHYIRQIPALWWRWAAYAFFSVQCTTSSRYAAYGARRWSIFDPLAYQFTINSLRSVFTKITFFAQFLSKLQYFIFYRFRRAVDIIRNWRSIIPINSIQSLIFSPFYPILNSRQRITVFFCHLSLRCSMPYFTDHCSPLIGGVIF